MRTNRVPCGIPAGGQFAATAHTEPTVSLGSRISESQIRSITNLRQEQGAPAIDLTDGQLAAVRDHIDRTGDFSYKGVRNAAETAYFEEHRYTPDEHRNFVASHGDTSGYYGDPAALRRDIEQMRKDTTSTNPAHSD